VQMPVSAVLKDSLAVSPLLAFAALAVALPLGAIAGTQAAIHRNRLQDTAIIIVLVAGLSIPNFAIATFLVYLLSVKLNWLPVAGWEEGAPSYLVLPVLTLALPVISYVARITRGSLLEVLHTNYVRTARARRLGEMRVLWRHALRPTLLPVVSYLGPATAYVVTGSLVVETVFGLPGTGRYLVQGALNRDYTLVVGMITVYGALTLGLNLVADIVYGWLDPTVRHE